MRYGEEVLAARGGMARAAETQGRATIRAKCINNAALILRGLIQ